MIRFIILMLISFQSMAETQLGFGGWSYHLGDEYDYNQEHSGIGVEYYLNQDGHDLGFGGFYMTDSYNEPAYHFGFIYRYELSDNFSLKTNFSYINRSKLIKSTMHYGIDKHTTTETLTVKQYQDFVVLPFINYKLNEHINVDFTLLPDFTGAGGEVLFFKLNYRL